MSVQIHRPRDAEELKVVGNDKPKSTKPRESDCILSSVLLAFSYIVNLRVRLEPFEEILRQFAQDYYRVFRLLMRGFVSGR